MNPLIQGKSGTTPVMSRNAFSANQGTNEDDSQSDPHPEAGIFGNQTMRNSGQNDRRDTRIPSWPNKTHPADFLPSWRVCLSVSTVL